MMSEDQKKKVQVVGVWLLSTVIVAYAALTTFIAGWVKQVTEPVVGERGTMTLMMEATKAGFPIWGIIALAAIIIFAGYIFYIKRQTEESG